SGGPSGVGSPAPSMQRLAKRNRANGARRRMAASVPTRARGAQGLSPAPPGLPAEVLTLQVAVDADPGAGALRRGHDDELHVLRGVAGEVEAGHARALATVALHAAVLADAAPQQARQGAALVLIGVEEQRADAQVGAALEHHPLQLRPAPLRRAPRQPAHRLVAHRDPEAFGP